MLFKEVNMNKYFMSQALEQAKKAKEIGEVPIGAVIVKNERIIARGFNERESLKNDLIRAKIYYYYHKHNKKYYYYDFNYNIIYLN